MSRVLICEDEQHIAEGIRFNLEADGHTVTIAGSGEQALTLVLNAPESVDILILDVMLPAQSGFAVATELRSKGFFFPILMLTARGREEDVLRGFAAGADDYLAKPFELSILLARVNGLLRRRRWNEAAPSTPPAETPDTFSFAGRVLDFTAMEVRVGGESHRLTLLECDLLRYLVRNAGVAVSRRAILEDVWNLHESTDTRAIDNFVVRLRKYLEERPSTPKFLVTVRGVGYKFLPDGGRS